MLDSWTDSCKIYVWLCLNDQIPEMGCGTRRFEYIGCTARSVVIKKTGKKEKLISKSLFEEVYGNGEFTPVECSKENIADLYSIEYKGKKREISFKSKNKNCKDKAKVYNILRKINPKASISKDIVNGIINNSKKKELHK